MQLVFDLIEALCYKHWMNSVPIVSAPKVYCINESIVKSTTCPKSTLKKKYNTINYHQCCEAIAAGHIQVPWIYGTDNLADALTKNTVGETRNYFFHPVKDFLVMADVRLEPSLCKVSALRGLFLKVFMVVPASVQCHRTGRRISLRDCLGP